MKSFLGIIHAQIKGFEFLSESGKNFVQKLLNNGGTYVNIYASSNSSSKPCAFFICILDFVIFTTLSHISHKILFVYTQNLHFLTNASLMDLVWSLIQMYTHLTKPTKALRYQPSNLFIISPRHLEWQTQPEQVK